MPQHKNPYPGGQEIHNFGKPFLGHHYYILFLSEQCLGEEKIFKEIHEFYPQITSPWGRGSWNLQFLVSLPYRCYIPNLVKIDTVVLRKMLTLDTRRRTPTHSNRSPVWLCCPKNLLQNHWTNFNQTWHKASLDEGNLKVLRIRTVQFS